MAQMSEQAPTGHLHVIAELVANEGNVDRLRELLTAFAMSSRKEPGCVSYELLEVQGEPGRFMTREIWVDQAAIDAHMDTPQIKAALPVVGPMLAKPFTQIVLQGVTG